MGSSKYWKEGHICIYCNGYGYICPGNGMQERTGCPLIMNKLEWTPHHCDVCEWREPCPECNFKKRDMWLYQFLNLYKNLDVKRLSEKMGWSVRKIDYYAKKLIRAGLIRKVYHPKKFGEMINWEEMKNTKRVGSKEDE